MAVSYIDTQSVKEISLNIIGCANEYEILINKLFKRFSEVPFTTMEWTGGRAEEFFNYVAIDKNEFINFGKKIRNLGKKISNDADYMDSRISNAKKIEKKD